MEDGATLRDHLKSIARQTGTMPEQLENAPDVPELAGHVWEWFLELNAEREWDLLPLPRGLMRRAKRLNARFICDWALMTGTRIEPWELRALRLLDAKWMETQNVS